VSPLKKWVLGRRGSFCFLVSAHGPGAKLRTVSFREGNTVDGRNPASQLRLVGSLSHYLRGFYTSQVVVWDFFHQQYFIFVEQALGIQSYSQLMIGVSNHLLSKVLRFHYHSQKVIGSLGKLFFKLNDVSANGYLLLLFAVVVRIPGIRKIGMKLGDPNH